MQKKPMPVVLITGASSGIGFACAQTLSGEGYTVYGTSRTPSGEDLGFRLLRMDVDDDDSVRGAVQEILDEEWRIDIVVNNAGMGYGGAVEDTSLAEAKATLETNFFGVLRVCQAVLPVMRSQGKGLIVNVSSIGGMVGLPFQGLYSASKFALEGLTQAMRMEVKPFGIRVVLINPGDTSTAYTKNRRICQASGENSAYTEQCRHSLDIIEKNEIEGSPPEIIAKTLLKIVRSWSPKPRYIAATVIEKLAVVLQRWLPESVFEWAVLKYYGM